MDVVLLTLPAPYYSKFVRCTPVGIAYLAACLENKGVDVGIIDASALELGEEDIIKILKNEEPQVIGISSTAVEIGNAVRIAKKIKSSLDSKVIIGGSYVTNDPTFIERYIF